MIPENTPLPSTETHSLVPLHAFTSHTDRAWHVSFNPSPSQPLLASCSGDKSVRLYTFSLPFSASAPTPADLQWTELAPLPTEHRRTVRALAWAPGGRMLATASFDSSVGLWEREEGGGSTWECVSVLEGHESECKSVAFSASGTLLASCSRDKSVWIWEIQPGCDPECLSVQMEHSQDVKSVAFHPTDELLASASYDDTINLYVDDPTDDWYVTGRLKAHTSTVWALAFSPCGQFLLSGSDDLSLRVWGRTRTAERRGDGAMPTSWKKDEDTWEVVASVEGAHDRTIYSVAWGTGGVPREQGGRGRIASAGGDGVIRIFQVMVDPSNPSSPPTIPPIATRPSAHGIHDINSVAWCPVPSASSDASSKPLSQSIQEDDFTVPAPGTSMRERAHMENVLASSGDDGAVRLWWLREGTGSA